MSYKARVFTLLAAFALLVLGANGYLVYAANQFASDRMEVGPGHSKFPPQADKQPAGGPH